MVGAQQNEGRVLAGRYQVDAPIAVGGMGAVYRGYDRQLDRRVAIKLMLQDVARRRPGVEADSLARDAVDGRERFLRETRTTAGLELPGVPAVYDVGVDELTGQIFLVMQLLGGQTLKDLIASYDYPDRPMHLPWAAAVAAQVAATLVDVHRVDVVHRDIKPSNLMVSTNGLVKVLDFGVAILRGARALPRLTQVAPVGTAEYMAPEQILDNPTGPPCDVYALGCVLYEMLVGTLPFIADEDHSYFHHHVHTPPPSARRSRSDVPADLDELIERMLAKKPVDRPDAAAVYDALLPLVRSDPDGESRESDPRRPFLRPLAPMPSGRRPAPPIRPQSTPGTPLTLDELEVLLPRVQLLHEQAQSQQAIDLLDDAIARASHEPLLALETKVALASLLFLNDEFSRAAAVIDGIAPEMAGREDASTLWYYAGVSHAELGHLDAAIHYLTAFLRDADPGDHLGRDATIRLAAVLDAADRHSDALARLEPLRPILVAVYGPDSVHVAALDRMIVQIRRKIEGDGPT